MISTCLGHKYLLDDKPRVSAYRQAILETVEPGDVVVDLGCGSGLLGFLACQAGARRVYAIEQARVIECARRLAVANSFQEQVIFIKDRSTGVTLPEKADVIVSDFGFSRLVEGTMGAIIDARQRFLKPGGALIPAQEKMFIAPIEAGEAYQGNVAFWNQPMGGVDYSPVQSAAVNKFHSVLVPPDGILSPPVQVESLDWYAAVGKKTGLDRKMTFVVERAGTLHGLAGWFEAQLSPGVLLSTEPAAPPTLWKQLLFPIAEPVAVIVGDVVRAQVTANEGKFLFWTWRIDVIGADGASKGRFEHSDLQRSLTKKTLLWHVPDFRPELTEDGQIARFVLGCCDGKATVHEIAARLQEQFPEHCPTEKAATSWVQASLKNWVKKVDKLSDLTPPLAVQGKADSDLLAAIPVRHPRALLQDVEGETLLLRLDSGLSSVLSGVGGTIWELTDGVKSLAQIVDECAAFYQVDREQVQEDVLVFVQQLLEQEWIAFNEPG